jgi:hypothetical protein
MQLVESPYDARIRCSHLLRANLGATYIATSYAHYSAARYISCPFHPHYSVASCKLSPRSTLASTNTLSFPRF